MTSFRIYSTVFRDRFSGRTNVFIYSIYSFLYFDYFRQEGVSDGRSTMWGRLCSLWHVGASLLAIARATTKTCQRFVYIGHKNKNALYTFVEFVFRLFHPVTIGRFDALLQAYSNARLANALGLLQFCLAIALFSWLIFHLRKFHGKTLFSVWSVGHWAFPEAAMLNWYRYACW